MVPKIAKHFILQISVKRVAVQIFQIFYTNFIDQNFSLNSPNTQIIIEYKIIELWKQKF